MKKQSERFGLMCVACGRRPRIGFNRPHSLHRTKRIIRPNLQKYAGMLICTRCRRSITKIGTALKIG